MTRLPGTVCFNMVDLDDAITLEVYSVTHQSCAPIKHLLPGKHVINIIRSKHTYIPRLPLVSLKMGTEALNFQTWGQQQNAEKKKG